MARKAAQEKASKKAKKQKKILIILALPMLGALVYAYTTMSSLGGKAQVAAPAATTVSDAVPAADATDAPVTPGVSAPPVAALGSFLALGRKDPFNDHGPKPGTGSGSSGNSTPQQAACKYGAVQNAIAHERRVAAAARRSGRHVVVHAGACTTGKGESGGNSGGNGSQPKPPSVPLTGAVISDNGDKLSVAVGGKFGSAPGLSGVSLFRLEHVTKTTALISVVGTKQHFTLHVNQPLTLKQNGGWTYTLILEPVGSAVPMTVQPTPPVHDAGSGG